MEDLETKIWNRIQGKQSLAEEPVAVAAMYMKEKDLAEQYRILSRETGKYADKLYILFRNQQRCLACLKGLYRLLTDGIFEESRLETEKKNPLPALRKCFVEEVGQREKYEKWSDDREYGALMESLGKIKRENCVLIAEIIGGM